MSCGERECAMTCHSVRRSSFFTSCTVLCKSRGVIAKLSENGTKTRRNRTKRDISGLIQLYLFLQSPLVCGVLFICDGGKLASVLGIELGQPVLEAALESDA